MQAHKGPGAPTGDKPVIKVVDTTTSLSEASRYARVISSVLSQLVKVGDRREHFDGALGVITQALDADNGSIMLHNADREGLVIEGSSGLSVDVVESTVHTPGDGSIASTVYAGNSELISGEGTPGRSRDSSIVVPIRFLDTTYGVLSVNRLNKPELNQGDVAELELIANAMGTYIHGIQDKNHLGLTTASTITALVKTIDAKDTYTAGHSLRVASLSAAIGKAMGLNADQQLELQSAGMLHDLGKIGVAGAILRKDSVLTDSEYDVIKEHPLITAAILEPLRNELKPGIIEAVLMHHEKLDGTGYPNGVSDNIIPLYARILAVADTYDAMRSRRVYNADKPRPTIEDSLFELARCSGTQFDSNAVNGLAKALSEGNGVRLTQDGKDELHKLEPGIIDGLLRKLDDPAVAVATPEPRNRDQISITSAEAFKTFLDTLK